MPHPVLIGGWGWSVKLRCGSIVVAQSDRRASVIQASLSISVTEAAGKLRRLKTCQEGQFTTKLYSSYCEQVQVVPRPFRATYYREKRLPQRISAVSTCIQFPKFATTVNLSASPVSGGRKLHDQHNPLNCLKLIIFKYAVTEFDRKQWEL